MNNLWSFFFFILDSIPVCVSFYHHRVDCQLISCVRTESYRWPRWHTLCTNCMVHRVARLGSSTALANSQAQPKHRNNYTAWDMRSGVSRNIDTTKSSPWHERTGVSQHQWQEARARASQGRNSLSESKAFDNSFFFLKLTSLSHVMS